MALIDPDRVSMVPPTEAVRCAYAMLDYVQSFSGPMHVAGAAVLFTVLCDELQLDPSQLIDAARRRMRDHQDQLHAREVDSLRAYIRGEIAR